MAYPLFGDEAKDALKPLVALESALISHGLPYPKNLETAQAMEEIVREGGATPVTIGIIGGRPKVGLSRGEVERLGRGSGVRKVSLRDLPAAVARGWDGGTTVSATLYLAHKAGIRVLATGGIGGVHRGKGWDLSADLLALAQTPLVVICSGAKAILDLPATLEWLETSGVPIIGYGTGEFPAFYSRSSGLPLEQRVDTPQEVAEMARARDELGLSTAILVTVPLPEEDEVPSTLVEEALAKALEMAAESVRGAALTPFLLARMNELTRGATLRANIALLKNNARVAAGVAQALITA
ncbi:MAG TPA: pseudouridine-5-phosphate glycosidase [Chloroflexi bacterium]|nr:pseudouridine-5-phosphate glycosidase [Chloroflexota bacterium]